jgi:hypothetical protein
MPNVLADYLEDPDSIIRRIRSRDHDSMFWLVEAAPSLRPDDARRALSDSLAGPLDPDCRRFVESKLSLTW